MIITTEKRQDMSGMDTVEWIPAGSDDGGLGAGGVLSGAGSVLSGAGSAASGMA